MFRVHRGSVWIEALKDGDLCVLAPAGKARKKIRQFLLRTLAADPANLIEFCENDPAVRSEFSSLPDFDYSVNDQ
jgi:hypothetical protein